MSEGIRMDHSEYVKAYREGKIEIKVLRQGPRELNVLLRRKYLLLVAFSNIIFVLSTPVAIACFIWVKWWIGIVVFLFGWIVLRNTTKKTTDFYVKQSLEDSFFYKFALEKKCILIKEKNSE